MPDDRFGVVLRAVAKAGRRDEAASSVDAVCSAAVDLLSVKGAGISLIIGGELRGAAGVSDSGTALIQELHLSLGEGPCLEAWESRAPVVEGDLSGQGGSRWPMFAPLAIEHGVLAVFAFPLALGRIRIGVLVLYRERAGDLSADELAHGTTLATVATHLVLDVQAGAPADQLHGSLAGEPLHWAEIHQATGMVSVQLGVPLDEAFVRLRAYAFAHDLSLRDVAKQVVDRRLRLATP